MSKDNYQCSIHITYKNLQYKHHLKRKLKNQKREVNQNQKRKSFKSDKSPFRDLLG